MAGQRRILQVEGERVTVATEDSFESEAQLHNAVAAHPEVLPHEDLGIEPLVAIGSEIDCAGGYIDLLAVDAQGKLVLVEFKKGSENPDVRKVIAQLLDYGASLWQMEYAELEAKCQIAAPGMAGSLAEHVAARLELLDHGTLDLGAFEQALESTLRAGDFIFVYVARDLDEKTRRIMTYLAEGPRMSFFAIEVDHFQTQDRSVMVPRAAIVPSWVNSSEAATRSKKRAGPTLEEAGPEVQELVGRLDRWAEEAGVATRLTAACRIYYLRSRQYGIAVYFGASTTGMDFDLASFRAAGHDTFADDFIGKMERYSVKPITARKWPKLSVEEVLAHWDEILVELVEPYFDARRRLAEATG